MRLEVLRHIVEERDTFLGRLFDYAIQVLIAVSLITFSLETLPNLTQAQSEMLRAVEVGSILIFTVEYILRLMVAEKKNKFVLSFFGIIDLAAIVPFYLSLGVDLRSIRAFRMLRLFRKGLGSNLDNTERLR